MTHKRTRHLQIFIKVTLKQTEKNIYTAVDTNTCMQSEKSDGCLSRSTGFQQINSNHCTLSTIGKKQTRSLVQELGYIWDRLTYRVITFFCNFQ